MKNLYIFLLLVICLPLAAQHKIGVRAGLNYSTFSGPLEQGEDYGITGGFHFGINYTYELNDIFGLRGELLYTQRGSDHSYFSEDSYNIIRPIGGEKFVEFGIVDLNMSISNSYFSLPVTAQVRLNQKFEIFGGISADFLVGPSGRGKLDFTSNENQDEIFYIQSFDHRYNSDTTGQYNIFVDPVSIIVEGERVSIPKVVGAYYTFDSEQKTGKRFNFVDAHLILGANYFINPGFYFGVRAEYGLTDITNNKMDYSLTELDEFNDFIFRDDFDRSLNLSFSFGFRF